MSLTHLARAALVLVVTGVVSACEPPLPDPPKQCDPTGAIPNGCLTDEICLDFKCVPRPKCETSDDCESAAFQCVLPAQVCELRPGFGQECKSPEAPCPLGEFCALGVCQPLEESIQCALRTDCPVGQKCDRVNLLCIPDAPCTLAEEFPELACDPGETCDAFTGQCLLPCQNQCTPETVEEDCGPQQRCDGACRCVQCLADDDCGAGLVCNIRAGRCQSEDLCFTDDDCDPPLICDSATQLCQVAPPACEDDFDCQVAEVCDIASGRCVLPDGPCEQDRFEPGADTPADAEQVDVAPDAIELLDELTLCPNDDDVFAIALDAGDVLTAIVTSTDARARATMFLLDSSGELSLRFAETAPRGNGTIVYVAEEEETVFLRVTALVAASPYDLTLERATGGATCQVDFFDNSAPNDQTLTASPLAVPANGVTVAGTICPGDVDYFNVSVAAGEALEATLDFDGAATDLDVALVDAEDVLIAQDAGASSPARVRQRFVTDQEAYLRVRGFGTATGAYTLNVAREGPFVCTPDAAEPDDDVATAPALALGEERGPEARTVCIGDEDLLVVPLEDFERLVVSATYDDSEVELAIDVLDATAATVKETSPPATGGAAVTYDASGDETVVVRVRGVSGANGPYTLRVEKENQLDCAPDLGEPNNTVQTATGLRPPGELLSICGSDQDFFVIEGAAGKKLVVDASFRQADADLDLMLLGLDGAQILAVADSTSDGEHLEAVLPLDGRYTLRVFSLTSGAAARYSLAVSQVTP